MQTLLKHLAIVLILVFSLAAQAQSPYDLERAARAELEILYASSPAASALAAKAKGVLVLPDVRESSLDVGALAGDGVLFIGGNVAGYYSMGGPHAGLEAGAESYSYAVFFMSAAALERLDDAGVLDFGPDPDVVVIDIGAMRRLPALTL